MGIYNTPQEERDIKTLTDLGFEVINPNTKEISKEFVDTKRTYSVALDNDEAYMMAFEDIFFSMVRECPVFAFRGLPNGKIPRGVAIELKHAQLHNKLIIELPCSIISRSMGAEETREYLRDMGER